MSLEQWLLLHVTTSFDSLTVNILYLYLQATKLNQLESATRV